MNDRMENMELMCDVEEMHEDKIAAARNNMPSDGKITDAAGLFKVLGDFTRLRLIVALQKNELCVCDLAEVFGMTKSAISHQLALLRSAKLVKSRREGKNIFYSLDDEHVEDIVREAFDHISHIGHTMMG